VAEAPRVITAQSQTGSRSSPDWGAYDIAIGRLRSRIAGKHRSKIRSRIAAKYLLTG
jgi:hypothetical protein